MVHSCKMSPTVAHGSARALKSGRQPNQSVPKNWGHFWGHLEIGELMEALCAVDVVDEFHSCSRTKH